MARPNVAIGRSEYIADEGGIHRSQDVRQGSGRSPKAPANYTNERENGTSRNSTSRGGRYDGADNEKREHRRSSSSRAGMGRERTRGSSSTRADKGREHEDTYLPHETYRAGADLESGGLGGNYRVSGL